MSPSFCFVLYSGNRIEEPQTLPISGGKMHYTKGNHLLSLLKGSRGDLLPIYKFISREEIPDTKRLFILPEESVIRANG